MVFTREKMQKLHGRSLFIFSKTNAVRRIVTKIISNWWFEFFILTVILMSSITLAIENPLNDPDSELSNNLEIVNAVITAVFTLE